METVDVETECGQTPDSIEKDSLRPKLDNEGEPPAKKRAGRPKGRKSRPLFDVMPKDLPPRSCRRKSVPHEVIIPAPPTRCLKYLSTDWTVTERQNLLAGLRVHNCSNTRELSKCVGTKSAEEVGWFLHNMRTRERLLLKEENPGKNTAPIEHWLKTCEDIVRYEPDHSLLLGSVTAVAGELEPHHPPYNAKTQPDYTKIYDYLARLLYKGPAPELSPIDSAVILDLLQNTVDVLRHTDISCEREMMKEKYIHLNKKNQPAVAEGGGAGSMSAEPKSPNVEEVRRQVDALRNDPGNTAVENHAVAPSTSREENEPVAGPSGSMGEAGTGLGSPVENKDKSQPKVLRPVRRRGRPRKSAAASASSPGGESLSQESNTEPSTGTQLRNKNDGQKTGKLVSINPFCIEVKYLKLCNIPKEDPR